MQLLRKSGFPLLSRQRSTLPLRPCIRFVGAFSSVTSSIALPAPPALHAARCEPPVLSRSLARHGMFLMSVLALSNNAAVLRPPIEPTLLTSDAVPRPPLESTLLLGAATRAFLSRTLGNHMVLQASPQKAIVWGATTPGAVVTTTFAEVNWTATADHNGTWRQQLPPTPASSLQSYTLVFESSTGETAKLQDVLFGEVFVCGGQSNMEMALPAATNSSAEAQAANAYPHIRIFSVGHGTSSATPLLDLQTVWEPWQVARLLG